MFGCLAIRALCESRRLSACRFALAKWVTVREQL